MSIFKKEKMRNTKDPEKLLIETVAFKVTTEMYEKMQEVAGPIPLSVFCREVIAFHLREQDERTIRFHLDEKHYKALKGISGIKSVDARAVSIVKRYLKPYMEGK